MRSDVEVGSALSGGLDSSAIVTVASGLTPRRFKTFSAYFSNGPIYDERKWIEIVNKKTNSHGHLISPPVSDFINDFEKMTWHHDYPLQGSSLMAGYYVMKLAGENGVKVLLDGQGSDEMLGGYNHSFYRYYADQIRSLKLLKFLQEYFIYLRNNKKGSMADRIMKTFLVTLFDEPTLSYYETRHKPAMLTLPREDRSAFYHEIRQLESSKLSGFLYKLMMSSSMQTLLHYEDRNSMAHSVESRVPFLDYRLVELIFSLPGHYKVNNGLGKYIHRQAMKEFVPKEILDRKDKIGFATPGEFYWLRGEMKDMAISILESSDFKNRGIYNTRLIRDEFGKYLDGKQKNASLLWKVIALEIWFKVFKVS